MMTSTRTARYVTLLSVVLALALTAALAACGSDEPSGVTASSGSAETDREALVAFYNATDGENWYGSDNWLSEAPLGEWEGVTTQRRRARYGSETNRPRLERGDTGGAGTASRNLIWLDLRRQRVERGDTGGAGQPLQPENAVLYNSNELSGEIPAELGSLSNLE